MATDDISLEPLLNKGKVGNKPGFVPVDTAGAADHRDPVITVTDTAQEITITADKRTIELQNAGSKIVYYGGSGVTSALGIKLFPQSTKIFSNVKDTFSIWLVCATGETAEVRSVEYD